jgi:hypothetical protein
MEHFMKRVFFLLSAMVVCLFAATSRHTSNAVAIGRNVKPGAVDVSAQNRAADTAELTRLAMEAGHAYAQRDLPSLEHLTADDFVQTDVRGAQQNRAQWLDFVRNRKSECASRPATCRSISMAVQPSCAVTGCIHAKKIAATWLLIRSGLRYGLGKTRHGNGTPSRTPTSIPTQIAARSSRRIEDSVGTPHNLKRITPGSPSSSSSAHTGDRL